MASSSNLRLMTSIVPPHLRFPAPTSPGSALICCATYYVVSSEDLLVILITTLWSNALRHVSHGFIRGASVFSVTTLWWSPYGFEYP